MMLGSGTQRYTQSWRIGIGAKQGFGACPAKLLQYLYTVYTVVSQVDFGILRVPQSGQVIFYVGLSDV